MRLDFVGDIYGDDLVAKQVVDINVERYIDIIMLVDGNVVWEFRVA